MINLSDKKIIMSISSKDIEDIDLIIKNNTDKGNFLYQTNLLSIQISQSDPHSKIASDAQAISKNISMIDFSDCEIYLKKNGFLSPTEVITFSKTDWNPALKTPFYDNANLTKANSVSFVLYAANGTKINMDLCSNTTVDINIHLNNLDALNMTKYNEILKKGYDLYDKDSDYFNSLCVPMRMDDKAVTINDRKEEFDNLNVTCTGGCQYQKINVSIGYLKCKCNSTDTDKEITPEFKDVILDVFNSTNFLIIECYMTTFTYPDFFNNNGFIGSVVMTTMMATLIIIYNHLDTDIAMNIIKLDNVIKFEVNYFEKTMNPNEYFGVQEANELGQPNNNGNEMMNLNQQDNVNNKKVDNSEIKENKEKKDNKENNAERENKDKESILSISHIVNAQNENDNISYITNPSLVGAGAGNNNENINNSNNNTNNNNNIINIQKNESNTIKKDDIVHGENVEEEKEEKNEERVEDLILNTTESTNFKKATKGKYHNKKIS